jgi:hypothetical protein
LAMTILHISKKLLLMDGPELILKSTNPHSANLHYYITTL